MPTLSIREWIELLCFEEQLRRQLQIITHDPSPEAELGRCQRARQVAKAFEERLRQKKMQTAESGSGLTNKKVERLSAGPANASPETKSFSSIIKPTAAAKKDHYAASEEDSGSSNNAESLPSDYFASSATSPPGVPGSAGDTEQNHWLLLMWCDEHAHKERHTELTTSFEELGIAVRKHKQADTCLRALRDNRTWASQHPVILLCSWRRRWCLELLSEMRCSSPSEDVGPGAAVLYCRTERQWRRATTWAAQNSGKNGFPMEIRPTRSYEELLNMCLTLGRGLVDQSDAGGLQQDQQDQQDQTWSPTTGSISSSLAAPIGDDRQAHTVPGIGDSQVSQSGSRLYLAPHLLGQEATMDHFTALPSWQTPAQSTYQHFGPPLPGVGPGQWPEQFHASQEVVNGCKTSIPMRHRSPTQHL